MTTDCLIALGGNVGDVAATIANAVAALNVHPRIEQVGLSGLYATTPVGANASDPFLNAAATLKTSLSPLELLDVLQSLESAAGRKRTVHWGPRPLDLDLILFGEQVVSCERLQVPHPACWYRRFVLDPSAEIAAGMVHPVLGETVGELRERLLERPLLIALAGEDDGLLSRLIAEVAPRCGDVHLIGPAESGAQLAAPAMTVCLDPATHARLATSPPRRRSICLPQSADSPQQALMDVLTSALDVPVRQSPR
ncbi:2-amino-4-hydroxy-6-hydroxymethyldihydropteridine diphosphokinase [Maioricimonas sp. JC845]|uniref:2-amino-4-hydroxy-6- hydroxymethyldihydropteridine diphosphokinase n=1 Tax=Maioricimonas sp. JC845 TaxID=3232138 RepID=UPI003458FE01